MKAPGRILIPFGAFPILNNQEEIHNVNLIKSLEFLCKAVERNSLEQEYWLSPAKIFQNL